MEKWRIMRINNQAKVGLATMACLFAQGYIFSFILQVEPHPIVSFVPLLPYVAYIYARGKRTWYYNQPLYWILAVVAFTVMDIIPFAMGMG